MARKGKLSLKIPKDVDVTVQNSFVTVKGPKGVLSHQMKDCISVKTEEGKLFVVINKGETSSAFQGLYRTLIENMINGVTKGFEKSLELVGVGYRALLQGLFLLLHVGFSHPVKLMIPKGIKIEIEKTRITVKGIDQQQVGLFAAKIREVRPPEPYKGKGIRYVGKAVRRKAGKAAGGKGK